MNSRFSFLIIVGCANSRKRQQWFGVNFDR